MSLSGAFGAFSARSTSSHTAPLGSGQFVPVPRPRTPVNTTTGPLQLPVTPGRTALQETTASIVNSPTRRATEGSEGAQVPPTPSASTRTGTRRKRTNNENEDRDALPQPPKRRARVDTSTPIATARQAGTGPILQPLQPPPEEDEEPGPQLSETPNATQATPESVAVSPGSTPPEGTATIIVNNVIAAHRLRLSREREDTAIDIWPFVIGLDREAAPASLPQFEIGDTSPISADKKSHIACRFCSPKRWKVWRNTRGGITSTVRTHFKAHHLSEWTKACEENAFTRDHASKKLRTTCSDDVEARARSERFSLAGFLERLVRWIAVDDQSINVVECPEFRELILYVNRELSDTDIPHRTLLTEQVLIQYRKEYDNMLKELQTSPGRVSFTLDLWQDQDRQSYMGMSAHACVEGEHGILVPSAHLLVFRYIEGSHAGEDVAPIVFKIIDDAGLRHKIGQVTLDNAGTNDTLMAALQDVLKKEGIPFHRDGNRIRCFPHIVNIAVQAVLDEFKQYPYAPTVMAPEDSTEAELKIRSAYTAILEKDPVGRVRDLVGSCRSSGHRRHALEQFINEGNKSGYWREVAGSDLRNVRLIRDCETRWSSTYLMIQRVLELYPALKRFVEHPSRAEMAKYLLTDGEYAVLQEILIILQVAHQAQQLVSSERTPTLSIALPAYELLLQSWRNLCVQLPHFSHYIGRGIAKIEEYVHLSRRSRIYVYAMVLNPNVKMKWIEQNWTRKQAEDAHTWMLEAMLDFRRAERQAQNRVISRSQSEIQPVISGSQAQAHGLAALHDMVATTATVRRALSLPGLQVPSVPQTTSPFANLQPRAVDPELEEDIVSHELSAYLRKCEDRRIAQGIDLYHYWSVNKLNYPNLYRLAIDVLPVQASAVVIERMFSSSKETDTLRRNRLNPSLMEALQVLKYRYKQARLDFGGHLVAREEDYTVGAPVTEAAFAELSSAHKYLELEELLDNAAYED